MAGKIPDDTLQSIRERVSIVEVVSGYVTLKKAGRNHLGLCPFHAEKTPSFTVNDDRGLFHCFGCGAGGSVFTFVMRAEGVGFREAVELLARRAGVALPAHGGREGGEPRKHLLEINDTAQRYFSSALHSPAGVVARQYLQRRGLTPTIIERYGIGFCPPSGAGLARALGTQRGSLQRAADLGLIGRRNDGSVYDRFRGRVTFCIRDGSGNIVGFGGRTLGEDQPKYLNSPESPLFHKGNVLFGLFEARQAIRETGRIVIVEGYLDALALVEAGIAHVVASLGTALTASQLRLARRFAPEVLAFFDGDRAGQQAAERAFSVCAEAGVWGLGAFLPDGFDPDSFVRERGVDATRALLGAAVPLADFVLKRVDPGADAPLPIRAAAAQKIGQLLARIPDAVQFSMLVRKAAQQLGVDEAVLRGMRTAEGARKEAPRAPAPRNDEESFRPEEMSLVETMALDHNAALLVAQANVLTAFRSATLAEAGQAILAAWEGGESGASVVDRLPGPLAARVAARVVGEDPASAADHLQVARDCIERIKSRTLRLQTRAVRDSLQQAEASGDERRLREQLQRAAELLRRKADGHA
jgi:DNA primase